MGLEPENMAKDRRIPYNYLSSANWGYRSWGLMSSSVHWTGQLDPKNPLESRVRREGAGFSLEPEVSWKELLAMRNPWTWQDFSEARKPSRVGQ